MKLPDNCLMQSPSGKWVFVGSVRPDLAYVRPDGTRPSDEDLEKARRFGPRLAGLTTRTFDTEAEAKDALESLQS